MRYIAAILLSLCFTARAVAGEATIVVVSDPPQVVAKPFLDFFYHYNRLMLEWWNAGGRQQVRGHWEVLVSTDAPADVALAANSGRGSSYNVLIAAIRREEGSRPSLVAKVPPEAQEYPLAAAQAAVEKTREVIAGPTETNEEVKMGVGTALILAVVVGVVLAFLLWRVAKKSSGGAVDVASRKPRRG